MNMLAVLTTALWFVSTAGSVAGDRLVWPPPPDPPRLEHIGEIRCAELSLKSGLFGKLKRFLGGAAQEDRISLPFDLLVTGDYLYLTCQNIPALVQVDRRNLSFRLIKAKEHPLQYPIALCDDGKGGILLTDSESGAVYRYADNTLTRFLYEGLQRPTGIAALPERERIYVVDTGDHTVKIYDYQGRLVRTIPGEDDPPLLYPTFITTTDEGHILVNDGLNYRIKRYDADGNFLSQFGAEGNGPGRFARPKGLAVDSDEHIYVVDNLFDNVQVFNQDGQVLLVVGSRGNERGQFWSPAGIDIEADTVFVADTFNDRIQILHYLGGGE
jgi:DNA-binding beta-propeller fold protein YncE